MRAAVCDEHGPPTSLRVRDVPEPDLAADQVRVAVAVAAVNFPDVLLVAGRYQIDVPTPFVPGSEVAGTVIEVGSEVDSFAPGDRVTATGMVGAFAEQMCVGAGSVRRIPDHVDFDVAAAAGVAHRTAFHAVSTVGGVSPGDELIVLGAGGGVGSAAVQIGVVLGATVTAVASSPEKLAVARDLGATHVIDRRDGDLRQALRDLMPEGFDVAVDPVGGSASEPVIRSMRWGGRFVSVGFASGDIPSIPLNLVLLKGVHLLGFQLLDLATNRPADFAAGEDRLAELIEVGGARPHIGARFALEEVSEALALVAAGDAVGKVLIDVAASS